MTVSESWRRIAAWAGANIPPEQFRLAPGASEQQIAELEKLLGFPLPEDLRESYRFCNGTDETVFPNTFEWDGHDGPRVALAHGWVVTLEAMGQLFQLTQRFESNNADPEILVPEIKPDFWSSKRLALTVDASDSGLRVDLDPAAAGTVGQVIRHDTSLGPTAVIAPSWAALLEKVAADIEAGIYYATDDHPWSRRDLTPAGENFIWKK